MASQNNQERREPTIFDRILAKEIPASIVHEDDVVLAFKDIQPQAAVHVLVIPKRSARNIIEVAEWNQDHVGLFLKHVVLVAKKLGLHTSGYRITINTGADGGQTVDYVHAHILGGEPLSGFGASR